MKRITHTRLLLLMLVLMIMVGGCAKEEVVIDKSKVHFSATSISNLFDHETYLVEVYNNTGMDIYSSALYLSFPSKLGQPIEENFFDLVGRVDNQVILPVLANHDSNGFIINLPNTGGLLTDYPLDLKNPRLTFVGFTREKEKEIPFEITGAFHQLLK